MAGWGAVGVGGAVLARAACAAASPTGSCWRPCAGWPVWPLAPGWTSTNGRSPRARTSTRTWRSSGTSLPYNLAHAVGNVVFCLLIGPAFMRALAPLPAPPRGALGALAGAGRRRRARPRARARAAPSPPAARRRSAPRAISSHAQNKDGGFGAAPRHGSSPLYTGWAGLGLGVGGPQPARREAQRRPLARGLRAPRGARRSTTSARSSGPCCSLGVARPRPAQLRRAEPARRDPRSGGAATARSPAS